MTKWEGNKRRHTPLHRSAKEIETLQRRVKVSRKLISIFLLWGRVDEHLAQSTRTAQSQLWWYRLRVRSCHQIEGINQIRELQFVRIHQSIVHEVELARFH